MNTSPNLFDFATSELSQDAFLCWFIAWADSSQSENDKLLHECASKFVKQLIALPANYTIESVEVGRQWNHIDVWAMINKQYFIVIENKKGTSEHSNQLKRYAEVAKKHYKDSGIEIKLVYFKMEEQGQYKNVEKAGFSVFGRTAMLKILKEHVDSVGPNKTNNILSDYYHNLKNLDKKISSYKELPLDKWHWHSWKGFYSELQKHLGGNWNYVPNPAGGFLGFWWHNKYTEKKGGFEFYLQLEQYKMIFKICCEKKEMRHEVREFYRDKLFSKAKELGIGIHKFGRVGQWMGVARLNDNENYRKTNADGLIDMDKTLETLKQMQHVLDEISKEINN